MQRPMGLPWPPLPARALLLRVLVKRHSPCDGLIHLTIKSRLASFKNKVAVAQSPTRFVRCRSLSAPPSSTEEAVEDEDEDDDPDVDESVLLPDRGGLRRKAARACSAELGHRRLVAGGAAQVVPSDAEFFQTLFGHTAGEMHTDRLIDQVVGEALVV